jgi:hypothetical protein
MAAIAASDLTYTLLSRDIDGGKGKRRNLLDVTFGDGALTYPAGGVPLTKGNLGCPNSLEEVELVNPASSNGFVYKYDATNEKLRIYQGDNDNAADAPLIELLGAATPAAATLRLAATGY